jgi:N-acetylglucosamine kinase
MVYGIDIGGTKIEIAIFDETLRMSDSWRVATPTLNYELFLQTIAQQVEKADEKYTNKCGVGIGMPGIIDAAGHSLSANIPCVNGKNVKADLERMLDRRITLENDCRSFALSEATGGAGENFSRVFGAIIGTGAAGGLCVNGLICTGKNNIVGEYGHIPLPATLQSRHNLAPIRCGCGLMSCMENYISGPGLANIYQHFYHERLQAEQIIKNIRKQEARSLHIFQIYIDLLAYTIGSIIQHYDPDVIVIGGGLSKVDEIVDALPDAIQPYLFKSLDVPPIIRATFGDSSGVRGAAILALQK